MGQTKSGAAKAMETIRKRRGAGHWARAGRLGGSVKTPNSGFAANRELASKMGKRAGKIGRKDYVFIKENWLYRTYVSKATGETVRFKRFRFKR